MALNPEWHFCPIFKKTINDGLCWEICYADQGIKKEAVDELMAYLKEKKLTPQQVRDKFCEHCKFCQWKTTDD